MLPNHAPLMVAERFKVLEALFPGRIDLGLGRAPGTDPITSFALRRRQDNARRRRFPRALPGADAVRAARLSGGPSVPQRRTRCRRTSRCRRSGCSARAATARSSPPWSAWALRSRIISPTTTPVGADAELSRAVSSRRPRCGRRTRSSARGGLRRHATRRPSGSPRRVDLNWVRRATGEYLPLASPEEAAAYPYSPIDRERIKARRERLFVGAPATVRERLAPLIAATKADEVMITTMIYDHAARRRLLRAAGGDLRAARRLIAQHARTPAAGRGSSRCA